MPNDSSLIGFEMMVDEVMRRWPATIRVFLDFRMNCVGCPIAGFHTVEDACREHGTASADFLTALRAAAAAHAANGSVRRAFSDAEEAVRIAHDDALAPAFDEAILFPRA
jgi:hybrid cluster-associated redox disulfide protein